MPAKLIQTWTISKTSNHTAVSHRQGSASDWWRQCSVKQGRGRLHHTLAQQRYQFPGPQPASHVTSKGNWKRNWHVSCSERRGGLRKVRTGRIGQGKITNCMRRHHRSVRRATYHFAKTLIAGRITTAGSLRVSKSCCLHLVGSRSVCWQ